MDFDYQMIKDSEMREREARLASLPVPQSQQPPARQIPPVKPRRSIKSRPAPKEEAGPPSKPANGRESETVVQKMPAAVLRCGGPGPLEALSPSLRAHTLLWFERSQMPHLRRPGQPLPCWLHGFATRREAEELLKDEPEGCFLVRLSESKIGFVLSYRGRDRCRHFILEQEEGGATGGGRRYLIAGETSRHGSLQELIDYYTQHAVGPFDEVLTMPCAKVCSPGFIGTGRGRDGWRGTGGRTGARIHPSPRPRPPPAPAPAPVAPPTETAQYAVVRKVMRKANSFPEAKTDEELEQVPNFIPAEPPKAAAPESGHADDGTGPGDPQYARVNKPPRAVANATPHSSSPSSSSSSSSGAEAQLESHLGLPPAPLAGAARPQRGSGEEQKYWELVPMHTYEETHHLTHPEESHDRIDFYAMGRRQDIQRSGEGVQNHLYSEVNLRGLRDGPPTVAIPPLARTPGLPLRPPPRLTDCPSPLDPALQRVDGRLPLTPPSQSGPSPSVPNSHSPIYEHIPEGGLSARPPLPPQNHRH
ncbi:SH2 domain-containing protein 7 [Anguilla rostrata]|uniref:SH2 domain-containing protein 7 n=1 Tax=Anguilla rostrata TaxID=7938 RepID=UPI0030CE8CF4